MNKRIKGITTISELLEYVTSLENRMIFDVDMKDGESFRYLYDEKYALDFVYYRLLKGYDGDRLERSREVLEELKQLSRGEILYYDEFKVKRV